MPDLNACRLLLPVALALALGACSGVSNLSNFSVTDLNPLKGGDPLRSADYNYFYKRDQSATGFVAASDLVGPDGRCAFDPAPRMAPGAGEAIAAAPGQEAQGSAQGSAQVPAQTTVQEPLNPRSNQALYFTAGPQTGPAGAAPGALPPEVRGGPRGIALAMTECQVVSVAGYTDRVEIGANARGERTVTLTYPGGDRPGIYHFRNGRLVSMERVAEPAQPKQRTKAAKSKPAR